MCVYKIIHMSELLIRVIHEVYDGLIHKLTETDDDF